MLVAVLLLILELYDSARDVLSDMLQEIISLFRRLRAEAVHAYTDIDDMIGCMHTAVEAIVARGECEHGDCDAHLMNRCAGQRCQICE